VSKLVIHNFVHSPARRRSYTRDCGGDCGCEECRGQRDATPSGKMVGTAGKFRVFETSNGDFVLWSDVDNMEVGRFGDKETAMTYMRFKDKPSNKEFL
jgi:hypothetical protein